MSDRERPGGAPGSGAGWEARRHAVRLLGPALALPAVTGLVTYALVLVPEGPWRGWLRLAVAGLGLAAVVGLVLVPVARWAAYRVVVTPTHVTVRAGLLRTQERVLPLAGVVEVRTVQTALGRVLGHGTLLVVPEDGPLLVADDVPGVLGVQALVLERATAAGAGRPSAGAGPDGHRRDSFV